MNVSRSQELVRQRLEDGSIKLEPYGYAVVICRKQKQR